MISPNEVQEKTFVKAVFGGYDMESVDEFLEPLTEDYIALYRENAVLKSKMKVLVEKLEEYRNQEQSMRKAILSAQRTADNLIAEAEKKSARIMADAQSAADNKSITADAVVAREEERINSAKETARSFIEKLEGEIRSHLELLENLKKQDLTVSAPVEAPRKKAFDFDDPQERPMVIPKTEPARESTEEIANEIEQNITRLLDMEEPAPKPAPMDRGTTKFTNLQFGNNYDPTHN